MQGNLLPLDYDLSLSKLLRRMAQILFILSLCLPAVNGAMGLLIWSTGLFFLWLPLGWPTFANVIFIVLSVLSSDSRDAFKLPSSSKKMAILGISFISRYLSFPALLISCSLLSITKHQYSARSTISIGSLFPLNSLTYLSYFAELYSTIQFCKSINLAIYSPARTDLPARVRAIIDK